MARKKRKTARGRVPGVAYPASQKQVLANRQNAAKTWKHGERAEVLTPLDVTRTRLAEISKDAPEIAQRYEKALETGDLTVLDPILISSLVDSEIIRRHCVEEIKERGVIVEDDIVGPLGIKVGVKWKANPVLEHLHEFNRSLGHTAGDQLLSRKSRGEGMKDLAITERLRRDAVLRGMDKSLMPAPPPIETTAKPTP